MSERKGVAIDFKYYPELSGSGTTYGDGSVTITLTANPTELPEYKSVTYKPTNNSDIIKEIKYDSTLQKGFPSLDKYQSVTVYYWSSDSQFKNPLLIQLGEGNNEHYKHAGGNNWTSEKHITKTTLKKDLDKLNCQRNQAHITDISKKSGYYCPGCVSQWVSVSNYDTIDYSYSHHLSARFSRFKDRGMEQTGIVFPGTPYSVYVYWYPQTSEGIPLLIHFPYSSGDCYQRESIDSDTWTEVRETLRDPFGGDKATILKLLKAILPTVTIDVGYKNSLETSKSSTSYEDTSGGVKERINVTRKDIENDGFVRFSHSVQDKDYFILGGVKYGEGTTFSEISSNFILKTVTAYYSGTDFKPENLILIEFEKKNGPNKYLYYRRENKSQTNWTQDSSRESKLQETELIPKLKELKEKLTNSSQEPDTAGGQTAQNSGESLSSQLKKEAAGLSSGVIAGIAIGVMGAVASIVILVWRRKVMVKAMTTL